MLGFILVVVGLLLLLKQQVMVDHTTGNVIDIKLNAFGHLQTRWVGVVPLLIGALFIGVPAWKNYETQPTLPVSGRLGFADGRSASELFLGVIPTSTHATLTLADGTYKLRVPRGGKGETYQAVALVPNSSPPESVVGVVKFDADGQGTFDYTFPRRSR